MRTSGRTGRILTLHPVIAGQWEAVGRKSQLEPTCRKARRESLAMYTLKTTGDREAGRNDCIAISVLHVVGIFVRRVQY